MSHAIVIFGASGDLTSRKLIPALFRLDCKRRLPENTRIVGVSRTAYTDQEWRDLLKSSTAGYLGDEFDPQQWEEFSEHLFYQPGDIQKPEDFAALDAFLDQHDCGGSCTRVYYLATAPRFYEPAIENLGQASMLDQECGPRRVVIEKPFGRNLEEAQRLNERLHRVMDESQVYRIDHYLGKETVQNILVLRFANSIFEPVWNRNFIDHVQITAAEKVTVGRRGDYYEAAGVLRDMFQNHLLQLLAITAMEAPVRFEADAVRNEKVKVLDAVRSLRPHDIGSDSVRAQYRTYRDEPGVATESTIATFAALKLYVDNWRWQGVPFYLRSGKGMNCRTTQIVIQFREPPHMMFDTQHKRHFDANRLVIHIQPAEGMQLHFQSKVPDSEMDLRMMDLEFRFDSQFQKSMPDAYERLLLDTFSGDASLFARSDEVECAWRIIDPIFHGWEQTGQPSLDFYEVDEWGPASARKWLEAQGRNWLDVCPVLH